MPNIVVTGDPVIQFEIIRLATEKTVWTRVAPPAD